MKKFVAVLLSIIIGLSLILAFLIYLLFGELSSKIDLSDLVQISKQFENDDPKAEINKALESYSVVKVVDGDTVHIERDGELLKIRMIGIDAPEVRERECFANESTNKLKEMIGENNVYIELDETQGEFDRYNRTLAYIFLSDQTNLNLEMIRQGYAHEYTYNKPYKYQSEFKQAQREARENERGLWGEGVCGL
jgi:endonuclease YncB( thermonuclease family)